MLKGNSICLAFGVFSAWLFVVGGTSLRAQTANTLKTIEKCWKDRQERIRSVRIDWIEQHTVPKGQVTDSVGRLPGGVKRLEEMGIAPGSTIPPEVVTFSTTATFSFDGEKVRLDYDDKQWSGKKNAYVTQPETTVFDGKERKRYLRQGTSYTPWPFGSRQVSHPFRSSLVLGPLVMTFCPIHKEMRLFDVHALTPTGRQMVVGSRPCLELQRRKTNSEISIWVDPARDFAVTRVLSMLNERIMYKIDIKYEKHSSGEWIPISWERVSFRNNGKLERSTRAKLSAVKINEPADPGYYDLVFPVGTPVRDETDPEHLRRYIVREGDKKRIISPSESGLTYEQLVNSEPEGVLGLTWNIFSSVSFWAAALALASGGWLLWRRGFCRKRRELPGA